MRLARAELIALAGAWLVALAGLGGIWSYKLTPGEAAAAPTHWPGASALAAPSGEPVVLLFAHPMCACTAATMVELARVDDALHGDARIVVVVAIPLGVDGEQWSGGPTVAAAQALGAEVWLDRDEVETHRFGAYTSGQVEVFDAKGRLQFAGGITSARGHEGDNGGVDAVIAAARGVRAPSASPVFGCELAGDAP